MHNVYHDIFIYPENGFSPLQEEHLNMVDGKVIVQANNFGSNLLNQLKHFLKKPALISENEIQTRKVWYKKMANRAEVNDLEGKYRHIWAILQYWKIILSSPECVIKALKRLSNIESNTIPKH